VRVCVCVCVCVCVYVCIYLCVSVRAIVDLYVRYVCICVNSHLCICYKKTPPDARDRISIFSSKSR